MTAEQAWGSWHVPEWVRVPRLERLLDCRLGDLTWDVIAALPGRGVTEDLTLDFKRDLYSGNDKGRKDLSMDLAAFANAAGGLVILGIDEDNHGRAVNVPKVDLSDAERNRMVEILTTRVAPLLPDLTVGSLHDPDDPHRGVFLLLVPSSDSAPHGVRRDDWYVWPTREDRTKRCMHEPELAARYRARIAAGQGQLERMQRAELDARGHLHPDRGWLTITMSPSKPGRLPADRETLREWMRDHFVSRPWALAVDAGVVVGRRRVIFTDQFPFAGRSSDHHVELHADGTGFAAIALATDDPPHDAHRVGVPTNAHYVDVHGLAQWTVTFLDLLANHAMHTGASGDLCVRARLTPGHESPAAEPAPDAQVPRALFVTEPYEVDGAYFGSRIVPPSRPLTAPEPFDTFAPPSIATSARDLVAAAADIAHELVAEFGATPSRSLLRLDGSVDAIAASVPASATFRGWAYNRGVLEDDQ